MKRIVTISIFLLVAVVSTSILLNKKEQDREEYFELVIGNERTRIILTEDWRDCENQVLRKVKPLWDNLKSGESTVFYITYETDDKSSTTIISPHMRFYRDRDGISGLEQVYSDCQPRELIAGYSADWMMLGGYLHEQIKPFHEIYCFNKYVSEQVASSDSAPST